MKESFLLAKINPRSFHFRLITVISLVIFVASCIQEFIRGFDAFKIEKSFIEPILWIYFAIPICGMWLSFRFIVPIWSSYILIIFIKAYLFAAKGKKNLVFDSILLAFVVHFTFLLIAIPLHFSFLSELPGGSYLTLAIIKIANWPILLIHTLILNIKPSVKGIFLPEIGAISPITLAINIIFWGLIGVLVGFTRLLILKWRKER